MIVCFRVLQVGGPRSFRFLGYPQVSLVWHFCDIPALFSQQIPFASSGWFLRLAVFWDDAMWWLKPLNVTLKRDCRQRGHAYGDGQSGRVLLAIAIILSAVFLPTVCISGNHVTALSAVFCDIAISTLLISAFQRVDAQPALLP